MDWLDRYLDELAQEYTYVCPPTGPYKNNKSKIAFHAAADSEMEQRVLREAVIREAREQELVEGAFDSEDGYTGDQSTPVVEPPVPEEITPETIVEPTENNEIPLEIWYDAMDGSTIQPHPNDGASITQWNDKSQIAHNANSSGASEKPTYLTTGFYGTHPVVDFDGVSNCMTVNPLNAIEAATQATIYLLVKLDNLVDTATVITTTQGDFRLHYDGFGWLVEMDTGNMYATTTYTATTNVMLITLMYDGSQPTDDTRLSLWIDRAQQELTFTGSVPPTTVASNNNTLFIGCDPDGSNSMDGYVAEILYYNRTLTPEEMFNVDDYLQNKWGVFWVPPVFESTP